MTTALLVPAGYLVGSMPFGYWLVRLAKGVDIRTLGSGNIGATNVWRTYGWRYGAPVIFLDVAKGFVPTLVAVIAASDAVAIAVGAAAMAGHARPLFLRFEQGGKMVATGGGVFFALAPLGSITTLVVWIAVFLMARYVSAASVTAAAVIPAAMYVTDEALSVVAFSAVAGAVIIYLHRGNLRRLRAGTESRFRLPQLRLAGRE